MSAGELSEWEQLDGIEPIGWVRDDWHAARLMALYVNAHRGRAQRPHKASEFLIKWTRAQESEVQTDDQREAVVRTLAGISG